MTSTLGPRPFSPEAFADAIDALRARRKSTVGDLTIWEVAVERDRFAAALSREVRRGRYVFEPAHIAVVHFDGREREVFRSTVLDAVIERVVGRWLQEAIEPSLSDAEVGVSYQFERVGYYCADEVDHTREHPVFNLTVGLKDSWAKIEQKEGGNS